MVKWIEHRPFISMIRGSNPVLVIGIFLQDFIISATLAPSGLLSGESTFHYHQLKNNWLAQIPCFHHELPVCKSEWVCMKDVCSWGLFRPEHSGGYLCRMCPLSLELCQSPLHAGSLVWYVREWISDRGFIGSSGTVGVYL
jgi:hypothetical protein